MKLFIPFMTLFLASCGVHHHRYDAAEDTYYQDDYYAYGLPAAPSGLSWVLVGNDAYLVDAETGLIDLVITDLAITSTMS